MEVLQRTANRGSISTASAYEVDNSLKFEADNSEYMHYTCSSQTDYERMAYSVWLKRTELSTSQVFMEFGHGTSNTSNLRIGFDDSDRLFCYGNSIVWRQTNQVFRDTSAWYHLFFLFDTTTPGGISNNRIRIWVNGSMIDHTDFGVINNPGSGAAMGFNNSLNHSIGRQTEDATAYFCGYMAQVFASGGTPPVVGDFGETDSDTGIWIPKDISDITPPDANGFNLDFSNSGSLGNDISSRNNDFTLVNITAADQATDTPTNNFCTWTRLWTFPKVAGIENGGTSTNADFNASTWRGAKGSMGVSKGKWYWEQKASGNDTIVGWQTDNCVPDSGTNSHNTISTIAYYEAGNFLWIKDSTSGRNADTVSGTYAGGQIVGIALKLDSSPQTVTFYRNGSAILSNRNIDGLANQTLFPMTSHYNQTSDANFGGYTNFTISSGNTDENGYGNFEYAPPSDYYALCSQNLALYG